MHNLHLGRFLVVLSLPFALSSSARAELSVRTLMMGLDPLVGGDTFEFPGHVIPGRGGAACVMDAFADGIACSDGSGPLEGLLFPEDLVGELTVAGIGDGLAGADVSSPRRATRPSSCSTRAAATRSASRSGGPASSSR